MNDSPDFKLPSRSPTGARGTVAKQATRLWPFALLLVIAALSWFLLRPDTIPDQNLVKPVIESIDDALEVFADREIDVGLDEQANAADIVVIADRKQSPVIQLDELPALDRSDRQFFESLKGVASAPEWLAWLPTDEFVRKLVTVVDKAVDGDIGRSFLSFPNMENSVEVIESGEHFSLLESNYGRYALYVSIVDKFDAQSIASIYTRFEPLFEGAYSELGYSNRNFRTALERGLQQASIGPPPVPDPKLKKVGDRYQYVDLLIEGLPAIQKLYLRIGPENTQILRNKVAEIQQALQQSGI
ncbi:MAG: DUF3014 domain-containing protein [Arenicellaceae bacterium]|nr:DUF3014 domain-containing protein [Arenicellaceae bacterium]